MRYYGAVLGAVLLLGLVPILADAFSGGRFLWVAVGVALGLAIEVGAGFERRGLRP